MYLHICVFGHQTLRNINFEIFVPLPFQIYSICRAYMQLYDPNCICVCVFVYLYICVFSSQTLANIDFDILVTLPFQKYSTCNLKFLTKQYLCICLCVFGHPRLSSDRLERFVTSPFSSFFCLGTLNARFLLKCVSPSLNNKCPS